LNLKKIFLNFFVVLFVTALITAAAITGCKNDPVSSGDCPASERTGAICNDGTSSSATGSGACSSHGGVKQWICR